MLRRVLTALALGTALLPGLALADGFTIVDGQTVGQQVMTDVGDIGLIEAGGTISTSGAEALLMQADAQTLRNYGVIETIGAFGVQAEGDNTNIYNYGSITSNRNYASSVFFMGTGTKITNLGYISGTAIFQTGILGIDVNVENYGTITMPNVGGRGIMLQSGLIRNYGTIEVGPGGEAITGGASVYNYGSIISRNGDGIRGQIANGTQTIVNEGQIIAGDYSVAVSVAGTLDIMNSGSISGQRAVYASGSGSRLSNSGKISALNAVSLSGGNSTLELEAGSAISGHIGMGGSGNKIVFGPGLNSLTTYSGSFETIETPNPYVALPGPYNNTIAVLDRAGFVLSDDMLLALADDVGAAGATSTTECLDKPVEPACSVSAWIGGFGGTGRVEGTDDLAGRAWGDGGIETGLEFAPVAGLSAGAYVAGLSAHGDVGSSQDTDMSGGAVGAHLGYDQGSFFADLSASYGLLDITSKRSVADNTVSGGLATATADSTGSFVSPTLAAGVHVAMGGAVLTPSLRLRYTHLALDGYEETGANDNLVVDDRSLDELALRAQLALALTPILTESGEVDVTFRVGADGKRRTGDEVTANLLGSDISFASGSAGESYGGFLGANLDYRLKTGVVLSGNIEYSADTSGSRAATARATLSAAF